MPALADIPMRQKSTAVYIARHECKDFGVIIPYSTARALQRRGLAIKAQRRRFARETGICLRLTPDGHQLIKELHV